jgi:hypothetical protein
LIDPLRLDILIIVGTIVFIACATYVFHKRKRSHKGLPREEFVRAFAGIPPEIPDAVYTYSTGSWFFRDLSVRPEDSYEAVLQKGEDDVDDDGKILLKQLGLKLPPPQVLHEWDKPIITLADMVLWLDWVRRNQNRLN